MQHIADVKAHATLASGGEEIDFKLSESHGALNKDCCVESGFQQLAIRECDELVSLNLQQHKGCAAETSAVFTHSAAKLTPTEFHSAMGSKDNLVLIDTRNIYEHSIGHMHVVRCHHPLPQSYTLADLRLVHAVATVPVRKSAMNASTCTEARHKLF